MKQHDVLGSPGTNQDWNKQHCVHSLLKVF